MRLVFSVDSGKRTMAQPVLCKDKATGISVIDTRPCCCVNLTMQTCKMNKCILQAIACELPKVLSLLAC